jgi:outer membrane autotransporter protein
LALQVRLGWSHEYASAPPPVTATLAGAPLMPFTTYGVAPTRDGAVVGFSANTAVADGASVYLRYEGNVSGPDSAHALTAGLRVSW